MTAGAPATGGADSDRESLRERADASEQEIRARGLDYPDPELQRYLESLAALLAARFKIALCLIDANTGELLWADSAERNRDPPERIAELAFASFKR